MDKKMNQQTSGPTPPQEALGALPVDATARPAGPQPPSISAMINRTLAHWYVAVLVALAGIAFTVLVVQSRKPAYRSETVIFYREGVKATYLGPDGPDPLRTLSARLKETLLARSNLEKVVTEFNLFPDVLEKRGMVDAVDRLRMKITFKARSTDTFAISAEGETREQAQEVTQRLADILVEETTRMRRSQAKLTNEFLDAELKRAEQDVEKAETELAAFLAEHPEFAAEQAAPGGAQTGAAIRAQERRSTTTDPTLEALERQAPRLRARLTGKPEQVAPSVGGAPSPALVRQKDQAEQELATARRDLADKQSRFTEQHPDVRAAAARVSNAEAALRRAEEALILPPAPVVEVAATDEAEKAKIKAQLAKIEREIAARRSAKMGNQADASETAKAIINTETEWSRLSREKARAQQRLADLEGKSFRAEMAASSEQGGYSAQIEVLDPAYRPSAPSSPSRLILAIAGLFVSVAAGIAAAAARGIVLDDRVYDMEDIDRMALAPVLVVVPANARGPRGRRG
ncbi:MULTISPECIES: protein kinase [Sorangium]|uniref:Protein kinase involved in polysaccharide biosynthesis n=1 Tax=Sorangium cellulosum TaxID=56 RepID=A0A4P2QH12_SORCE|nr:MULTISPECIES: protein kinase [Sorangium]AUX29247.1 protein kinase involved in polysaccharide biosynthesis [Sorangium cellulosum]WCQ88638.1 Chromosome partition protein Smc [Sorangium sp. Soce836]